MLSRRHITHAADDRKAFTISTLASQLPPRNTALLSALPYLTPKIRAHTMATISLMPATTLAAISLTFLIHATFDAISAISQFLHYFRF